MLIVDYSIHARIPRSRPQARIIDVKTGNGVCGPSEVKSGSESAAAVQTAVEDLKMYNAARNALRAQMVDGYVTASMRDGSLIR